MSEYIHATRGTEINLMTTLIKVTAEGCLAFGNRILLYIDGLTTVGSACCGSMECRIIYIPGFVVSWHDKLDDASGNPVSIVEPLTDPYTLEDVKKLLFKTFPSSLFMFS
jgi:hypothetical protein